MLKYEGIDFSEVDTSWLPLEPFDDTEFDSRTSEQWINLGKKSVKNDAIPGKGLFKDNQGRGKYRKVLISE